MRALYEELYDRLSRDLMMIRFEIYSKNDERVMELIGDIKGLPGFSGGLLFDVVTTAVDETARLIEEGDHAEAYDLIDCVHCLPDILASERRDMKAYWKLHISRYQKNGHVNFSTGSKGIYLLYKINCKIC